MKGKSNRTEGKGASESRDARLKAALKANLQKRKEQARARADETSSKKADKAG